MNDSQPAGVIHALLIGIDHYLPNRLPDGSYYPSLSGCVRDVSHVEDFLRTTVGVAGDRIVRLTASNGPGVEPVEPREQWPTYENLVAAFGHVIGAAHPGDQVVIHYAGHGGRATTAYPTLKGDRGLDEALVPPDIGDGSRYLRDVELAHLLAVMVDKGLVVSVQLDSCHSGGAARGTEAHARAALEPSTPPQGRLTAWSPRRRSWPGRGRPPGPPPAASGSAVAGCRNQGGMCCWRRAGRASRPLSSRSTGSRATAHLPIGFSTR